MLNLGVASIRGLIAGGAVFHGLDTLDQHEFRDWLAHYGADEMSVWSPPVKALYDLVFAYAQGKADRPNLAAGGAMRTILRICFTYKGAFCFKMQAGMGDTVFTPIYKLLRHCGAKFKFFHKVESLHLTDDKTRIASIDLAVQANVKPEQLTKGGEYEPLIPVTRGGATLLCWPSTPQFDQLLEGDELRDRGINLESSWTDWTNPGHVKLTLGEDFASSPSTMCSGCIAVCDRLFPTTGM